MNPGQTQKKYTYNCEIWFTRGVSHTLIDLKTLHRIPPPPPTHTHIRTHCLCLMPLIPSILFLHHVLSALAHTPSHLLQHPVNFFSILGLFKAQSLIINFAATETILFNSFSVLFSISFVFCLKI